MNHSTVLMVARVIATNYGLVEEPFIVSYVQILQRLLDSHVMQDIECALSSLFIIFKAKKV